MNQLERYYHIIQKPVISEKATLATESDNAYQFRVPLDANKIEIRRAVEMLFKVKVLSVTTVTKHPKARRRGAVAGETQAWKKARVRLAEGNTIDIL